MYYDEYAKRNCEILDELDLLPFISREDTITNIIDKIEQVVELDSIYGRDILDKYEDFLEGCIFNYLCTYEIMDYLNKRYGTQFQEITEYYVVKRES